MAQHFALTVWLHDGRYHGVGEWPPAPARVFQALVAGIARGRSLPDAMVSALEQLELLAAPIIAAPLALRGQRIAAFVPNNDADSVGGDPDRINEIRTKKTIAPRILETNVSFLYAWPLEGSAGAAPHLVAAANELYQFGRGVDMAWAVGEVLDDAALEARLRSHRGAVYRPTFGKAGIELLCPTRNSLRSLTLRFEAALQRIRPLPDGDPGGLLFAQPPKPGFAAVPYDSPPAARMFELQRSADESALFPWPLTRVVDLVERLRDGAVARLREAAPLLEREIERVLVGRKADGSDAGPTERRVQIVPLPSIGHEHADRAVRRVMVQVPSGGPLSGADVFWAFSGLEPYDEETGVVDPFVIAPAADNDMLRHYALASCRWRSVTPVALPESAKRRRIEPTRRREEGKPATERAAEQDRAAGAVAVALRHAGVRATIEQVHVQREPFEGKGARAERFAAGARFAKERLWHVDLTLDRAITGPLAIGDGRFIGLGVMAPVDEVLGIQVFAIEGGLVGERDPLAVARSLRRAVMARVQAELGRERLASYFSGHADEGGPAQSGSDPHLAFCADLPDRLLVIAPHVAERRDASRQERQQLALLDRAVGDLAELRAGAAGVLRLRRVPTSADDDRLLAPSWRWVSVTPYTVNRHRKRSSARDAIAFDVAEECARRGLPRPEVGVSSERGLPGRGLEGRVELRFAVAVGGPLLLGRTRHLGGGLFSAR